MEFGWSEDDLAFRAELRAFLDAALPADWDEIAKGGPGSDEQVAFSRHFCAALAERGWLTQHWPAEYGGRDAPPWRHAIVGEEMWARGEPRGPQYMNVNWIGPAIMRFGSEEQKQLHLPPIARGDSFWCQGFSEPEAGSDLVALRTRGDPRRRRLRRERLEDLDLVRQPRAVLLPAGAHRSRRRSGTTASRCCWCRWTRPA